VTDNLYKVLGVDKKASRDDIRKAYRKLAKKLHPDLNPGDSKAEERFKKVSSAYNLLNDEEKRGRYDRGEIDDTCTERPAQQYYRTYADQDNSQHHTRAAGFEDMGDMSDLFSELFRQNAQRQNGGGGNAYGHGDIPGANVRYHLEIDFPDAALGAKKRVTMPDGATLDLSIPAGVANGQILRLKGKGLPGLGKGPAGDALIEIEIKHHPVFRREGSNIHMDLSIALDEAILGGKIEVPTVSGSVTMTLPKGSDSGQKLRLKGKGFPKKDGSKGDQIIHLVIKLPEKTDPELEDFMKTWRTKHKYNPRTKAKGARA